MELLPCCPWLNDTKLWLRGSTCLEITAQTNLYPSGWGAEQDIFTSKLSYWPTVNTKAAFC